MAASLLLHFDGGHGAAPAATDATGKAITVAGAAKLSTTQSKFGGASLALNGTTQYLSAANHPDFIFGGGDFTVEQWVYVTAITGSIQQVAGKGGVGAFGPFRLVVAATTGVVTGYVSTDGTSWNASVAGAVVPTNTWVHIALVRSGVSVNVYVNGVGAASPGAIAGSVTANSAPITYGSDGTGSFLGGYLDEVRVSKGEALYTAAFTPPTAPFASVGGDPHYDKVTLALHMDGENGGTNFPCAAGRVVTASGGAVTSTAQSKFDGSSAYFDGAGDFLTTPNSAGFLFGAGDFTVECWVYFAATPAENKILLNLRGYVSSTDISFVFYLTPTNKLELSLSYDGTTPLGPFTSTSNVATSAWNHVVLMRKGASLYYYINGVEDAATFSVGTNALFASTATLTIGGNADGSRSLLGYIDDLRITKGVARY